MSLPQTCLQLDVGNSSAKWRLLAGAEVVQRGRYRADDAASRAALLGCAPAPAAIWVSSVAGEAPNRALAAMLMERWGVQPWFAVAEAETLGLRNCYAEPARLGVDRWLAMLGARALSDGRLCVVDAGSALTIDFVGADGGHEGGYIIPGPGLMERALLLDTDRVRFCEPAEYRLAPGGSTAEAVRHGIALAQAGAVELALARSAEPVALVLTGGGGPWLHSHLHAHLHARLTKAATLAPDLVLDGLQRMAAARAV
ncbi:type III pantothenate kinase [Parahaliea mediterranea]|uniref:type III pantothenate kinase n=1 Tax=Parahaliea mediterranea TaxID=651086 RepID=UPI001F4D96C8|nr:type III pantothenate kinase [Parahaliea mediterranea]